jgi:Mn2+/Fe2+ NRAMP family transporter
LPKPRALAPFAGRFAFVLFAAGLVNASLMSAAILPLATRYNRRLREAPIFYGLFTALIVFGAGFVLVPRMPLLQVILISQAANGILLPFVLIFMLILVNSPRLMGEDRNGFWGNTIAVSTSAAMIGLTIALAWTTLR